MAQKSTFSKLQENFKHLYDCLKCASCERKINSQSKCFECGNYFCIECLYQSKKTKMCKSCEKTESIKSIKDRNNFIDELLDLIMMFDNDTGMNIVKDNFLNVETAENLERIFDKEKTSVFNQQKFIATSTPNLNNAKKVAFNSDITMIPQKDSQQIVRTQSESIEKTTTTNNNSSKKTTAATTTNNSTTNSSSNTNNSKRKADSIADKADNNSSKAKKAKLIEQAAVEAAEIVDKEDENEIAKENEINNEMVAEKHQSQTNSSSNRKSTKQLQTKEIDVNQENVNSSQINKHINELEERQKQLEDKNRQLEEKNRQLDDMIKLFEAKQDFEKNCTQLIKEQINKQMDHQRKEYCEQMNLQTKQHLEQIKKEFNNMISKERIQETVLFSLTQIISNSQTPIQSSIELDKIGQINFTIQPFKEIKKKMHDVEIQTDEKLIGENYVQTETPKFVNQSMNTTVEQFKSASDDITHSQKEIREVVNNVIDECNGHDEGNNKPINTTITNGNKSNNNFSIQFDDSAVAAATKDSKESNENDVPAVSKMNGKELNGDKEAIDSDELKKHVENDSIFDDSDDDIDEVGASSPIYE